MFTFTEFQSNRAIIGDRASVLGKIRAYCPASTKFKAIGLPMDGAKGRWIVLRMCNYIQGPVVEGYLVED